MKTSAKRNHWLYINSVILLLILVIFSIFPLVSGIWQVNQEQTSQNNIVNQETAVLESEVLGYQMVLQREPDNQTALEGLLDLKFRQGDLVGIIVPLERLAELNPTDARYMILLAQTKQQIGDLPGATAAYKSILANQPGNITALKGAADLLVQQNLVTDAISLVDNTLKSANRLDTNQNTAQDINITSVQLVLAEIYIQQNKKAEALKIYEEAIKTNPEDFRPLLAKAILKKEEGKIEQAKSLFAQSLKLAPESYKSSIIKLEQNSLSPSPTSSQ